MTSKEHLENIFSIIEAHDIDFKYTDPEFFKSFSDLIFVLKRNPKFLLQWFTLKLILSLIDSGENWLALVDCNRSGKSFCDCLTNYIKNNNLSSEA